MRAKLFKNSNSFPVFLSGILILLSLIFATPKANATITKELNYQGRLTNLSDINVPDTSYSIVFRIYDAASGGNCLWSARGTCGSPTARSVATSGGIFSIALGDTVAGDNAISLDFNSTYYLSVKIGADSEMSPRKKISASGYAFNSDLLDGLNSATSGADAHVLATDASGNLTVSGNVGIGTTTPGATLAIKSATALSGDFALDAGGIGFGNNGIIFEGATANTFENYLTLADPATADRTWTLPNVTGAIVTTGDSGTITSAMVGTDLDFADFDNTLDLDANLTLNQATYTWTQNFTGTTTTGLSYNANSLTTGTGLAIASTSTAGGASGSSYLLNLARSGANSNATHSAYGIYSNVTNTGTTSTNVAGYFSASGATNNYGLIVNAGNVGIGTTGPGAKLDVVSGQALEGIRLLSGASGSYSAYALGRTADEFYLGISAGVGQWSNGSVAGDTVLRSEGKNILFSTDSGTSAQLYLKNGGNVGIGTTGPGVKLDVNGEIRIPVDTAFIFGSYASQIYYNNANTALQFTGLSGANTVTIKNTGNVGIGTTGPNAKLEITAINTANNTNGSNLLITTSDATAIDKGGVLALGGNFATGVGWAPFGSIRGAKENSTLDNYDGYLQFNTIANGGTFTEKMRITSTGNVGIGTTGPAEALHIVGRERIVSDSLYGLNLWKDASATYAAGIGVGNNYMGFSVFNGTWVTDAMVILPTSGNVGIGTTSPQDTLHVHSGTNANLYVSTGPNTGGTGAGLGLKAINDAVDATVDMNLRASQFAFIINATEKVRIDTSGNVGIGTTAPSQKLDVRGNIYSNSGLTVEATTANIIATSPGVTAFYHTNDASGALLKVDGDWPIRFNTNSNERMRVTGSGNVGIGTTGPLTNLDIVSETLGYVSTGYRSYASAQHWYSGAGITGVSIQPYFISTTQSGGSSAMAIYPSGNIGIGYDAEVTAKLAINGNVGIGTTSPAALLSLGSGTGVKTYLYDDGTFVNGLGVNAGTGLSIFGDAATKVVSIGYQTRAGVFTEGMRVTNGNVGIGITSPLSKLTLGSSSTDAIFTFKRESATTNESIGSISWKSYNYSYLTYDELANVNVAADGNIDAGYMAFSTRYNHSTVAERMRINSSGNVGIGTTGPVAQLDVYKNSASVLQQLRLSNVNGSASIGSKIGFGVDTGNYDGAFIQGYRNGAAATYNLGFGVSIGADYTTAATERMTIQGGTGNVGIGITNPTGELNVATSNTPNGLRGISSYQYNDGVHAAIINLAKARGTVSAPATIANGDNLGNIQFVGYGTTFVAHASIKATVNGTVSGDTIPTYLAFLTGSTGVSEAMRISSTGNVGIGTTAPGFKLEVVGTSAGNVAHFIAPSPAITGGTINLNGSEVTGAIDTGAGFLFTGHDGGTGRSWAGIQGMKENSTVGNYAGYLRFNVRPDGGAQTERMRITSGGNVGIGTTAPSYALEVNKSTTGGTRVGVVNPTAGTGNYSQFSAFADGTLYTAINSFSSTWTTGGAYYQAGSLLEGNGVGGLSVSANNASGILRFYTGGHNERMQIDSSGNVGIGTTAPGGILDIVGGKIRHGSSTTDATQKATLFTARHYTSAEEDFLLFSSSTGASWNSMQIGGGNASFNAATHLQFFTASNYTTTTGTERMRIDSAGNVGIGTTTPQQKFEVAAVANATNQNNGLRISTTGTPGTAPYRYANFNLKSDGAGLFRMGLDVLNDGTLSSTEAISVLLSGGNVGIGTTAPNVKLDVVGAIASRDFGAAGTANIHVGDDTFLTDVDVASTMGLYSASNTAVGALRFGSSSNTFITSVANASSYFNNGGNVGIGTTSPTYRLQLPNVANATGQGQANAWQTYSDETLKEEVSSIVNALSDVLSLRGVDFTWKGQGVRSSGFIAQEVEKIIPNLVSTDIKGIKSLDYGRFTPYLVEAIKQQQTQIENISGLGINKGITIQGNVGIGTTSPTERLTVAGNLNIIGGNLLIDGLNLNNTITGLTENQNKIVEQLTGQLADQDLSVDNKLQLIGASLDELTTKQIEKLKDQITTQTSDIATLQAQIADIQTQNTEFNEFLLALSLDNIENFAQKNAPLNIFEGQLEAESLVAGAFSVKVTPDKPKTIGEAWICPEDETTTDCANSSLGRQVEVGTTAVTASAKIFVTAENDTDGTVWVEKKEDNSGFKILIKPTTPISEKIKINWWIVEEE
jgi:hypothetical protein